MQQRRFSRQREQIYEAVCATDTHPTAEMVYERLKPAMPRLSLGTVYRNLRQMAAEGRLMELEGPVARFDADLSPHAHFRCQRCGAVSDVAIPYDAALDMLAAGGRTARPGAQPLFLWNLSRLRGGANLILFF